MQKVEGSSPFSRSHEEPSKIGGFSLLPSVRVASQRPGWKRFGSAHVGMWLKLLPSAASPSVELGAFEPALAARAVLLKRDRARRGVLAQGVRGDPEIRGGTLDVQPAIIALSNRHDPTGKPWRESVGQGLEDERPKRVLSPDELRGLVAAVDEPYRLIFELTAETGARLGEALGLVWSDVDFDAETVTFTHQLGKHGERVQLKTARSRRCIETTPALAAKLRTARLASAASGNHDFVFVSRAGTPHDHRSNARPRSGIVEPAPTFHNLRHSHGSALIAAGWDIEELSARLGHANVGTTQRAYVHAYDAARRTVQRRSRLQPCTTTRTN
jgi:integrase